MADELYLDNDFEPEYTVKQKNAATRVSEVVPTLTLTARLAASKNGAAIDPALSVTATEASGKPGTYVALFNGDTLRTHLAASYLNKKVWLIFGDGANIHVQTKLTVRDLRVV